MPQLERPNASIYYEFSDGTGPVVTLLNGHTRSLRDFSKLRSQLEAAGFRPLLVDNRGAGESRSSEDFTVADMAADVAAVWDRESVETTGLLGMSLGGMVAQSVATGPSGGKIAALFLASTAARASWWANGPKPLAGADSDANASALEHYFSPAFLQKHGVLAKAFVKEMGRGFEDPAKAEGIRQQRKALNVFDARDALSKLTCPTLVYFGAEDRVFPVAAAEELAAAISGAELEVVPAAGHLLLAEQPRALYEAAVRFFERTLTR